MSTTKFNIEKFDHKINFSIWQIQIVVVLINSRLKMALSVKPKKPTTMIDEEWENLDDKARTFIHPCISKEVLQEVIHEKTPAHLWPKLESLCMTKSLVKRLCIKKCRFTKSIEEGMPFQSHLDELNIDFIDLEHFDIKVDNENNVVLLVCSLSSSYRHLKKIVFYSNNKTISFENVESHLLFKEKYDKVSFKFKQS